jgi:hypothetical protein
VLIHNKHFKRNKNSWLRSASLHIIANHFYPLKWALDLVGEGIISLL